MAYIVQQFYLLITDQSADRRRPMKFQKITTAVLLLAPVASWAGVPPSSVPEPGVLSLLAAGGAIVLVARLLSRKK